MESAHQCDVWPAGPPLLRCCYNATNGHPPAGTGRAGAAGGHAADGRRRLGLAIRPRAARSYEGCSAAGGLRVGTSSLLGSMTARAAGRHVSCPPPPTHPCVRSLPLQCVIHESFLGPTQLAGVYAATALNVHPPTSVKGEGEGAAASEGALQQSRRCCRRSEPIRRPGKARQQGVRHRPPRPPCAATMRTE